MKPIPRSSFPLWFGRLPAVAAGVGWLLFTCPAWAAAIHDIQGSGSLSPLVGTTVTTMGIVTAMKVNGFFIQTPGGQEDANPGTSQGIFVFTSSAPPAAAAVGNLVSVTGIVAEFRPSSDTNSPSVTELTSPTMSLLSTGNALPVPITLTPADTVPAGLLEQLEKYEGMRVRVNSLAVVAPTQGTIVEASATATSTGVFFGVIPGVARPFREPGVQLPDPLPGNAPCCVPRFDANPEILRVDSAGQIGATNLEVTVGAVVSNLVGVLDYQSRAYTILPDVATPPTVTGNMAAIPLAAPIFEEFMVASLNLNRFFDTSDDPLTGDAVLTSVSFNNRLNKLSLAIRNILRVPEIIAVQEAENLGTLQSIAAKVNSDAVGASQPNPNYQAYLVEGNDPSGIDNGFLVKASRINVNSVTQLGKTNTYFNPVTSTFDLLHERPPLVLNATVTVPGLTNTLSVTAIASHLLSLASINDPTIGSRVRAKRRAQAEYLASLIQSLQTNDPTANIIALGDFNAYEFNDGFVDTLGIVKGTPAPSNQVVLAGSDLITPDLVNLTETVTATQRYSYVFDGSAQAFDHIVVNAPLLPRVTRVMFAHCNADFPETYRNDSNRPERVTDHDPAVAYFTMHTPPRLISVVRQSDGASSIVALGDTFRTNFVQANTNLATSNWITLGMATTNFAGELIFTDAGASDFAQRFYRIYSP